MFIPIQVKTNNACLLTYEEFLQRIGNKSVFKKSELREQYKTSKNLSIVELLYYGYFGAGNNVNMDWLQKNGCWAAENQYPTSVRLSTEQFKDILRQGGVNVSNVIVD